jgi:peptidoglycan hydrolase CwlO-like protein
MDEKVLNQSLDYAKESINALNQNQKFIQKDIADLNKKFDKILSVITDPKVNEDLSTAVKKKLLKG